MASLLQHLPESSAAMVIVGLAYRLLRPVLEASVRAGVTTRETMRNLLVAAAAIALLLIVTRVAEHIVTP